MPLFLVLTWLAVLFGAIGVMLQLAFLGLKPRRPQLGLWARGCFAAMAVIFALRIVVMISS